MNEIIINNTSLGIKEYNGQRVVTFKDVDSVHKRPNGTAKRNFNKNRTYFIEGEDYFVRNSYEAKAEFGITAPNGLILLAESGYYMLVKSFTDDLSWAVQRELTNCYFRVQKVQSDFSALSPQLQFMIQMEQKQKALESAVENTNRRIDEWDEKYPYFCDFHNGIQLNIEPLDKFSDFNSEYTKEEFINLLAERLKAISVHGKTERNVSAWKNRKE
ncbi:MAG: ORF6N domain-containing protein [Ruminococcus sp.]|nr:ORF6N domain-containing protein [Ruminococcus sp.]